MDWQHPAALYFVLPLGIAWAALVLYSERRRQQARAAFVAHGLWPRILPEDSRGRFAAKLLLQESALVAGLVALAGPQFGTQVETVVPRGSDLYVLIDVSRSMLADDVAPSRLGRAKADVAALVGRLEGERVGLIAFAGQAVVKCPLTVDYDSFRRALDELDPLSAPRGGTAIGDAIRKALEVFPAQAERDQAILLITDGDDQQSYPREAAAVAAERHVAIFTVGLGDTDRGSRIPTARDGSFVEFQGEQVWSKLDGELLKEIALRTSGVYVPAGTRAYDLGALYVEHLQGRRSGESAQQRVRRAERFQIFLAVALAALLADRMLSRYRTPRREPNALTATRAAAIALALGVIPMTTNAAETNPRSAVRDGLRLYAAAKYDAAGERFAAAGEALVKPPNAPNAAAAIAAFDEACAWHRQGQIEKARTAYLRAGLSPDRSLATRAHFNLGTLAAEQARTLAGEKPETLPAEKRPEILDHLKQAIAAYRHCLELQPEHSASRRNLELVRQWIKHFTEQWRAADRQKRRDESNLVAFLEFLMQSESALRESSLDRASTDADSLAELKRAQDELREEVPTVREKIAAELQPPDAAPNSTPEVAQAIQLLQGWADAAGERMAAASARLAAREPAAAAADQQAAVDELDRIWEAVIPFAPLLTKALADQTSLARELAEESAELDFSKLTDRQERTLRKSRLLAPKAEAELQRGDGKKEANDTKDSEPEDAEAKSRAEREAGLRKAIDLAPQAVEQMEAAVKSLRQKARPSAAERAEAARKLLEEIHKSQPPPPQENQDDKKQDDKKQDQKDQERNDRSQDKKPSEPDKKPDDPSGEKQSKGPGEDKPSPRVAQDKMEEALRKVREREQEKRERDRQRRAILLGRPSVEKDW